jgi:deazaflavin-dependent oxidoreductase (nitroreductase family)
MVDPDRKARVLRRLQKYTLNRPLALLASLGITPGYAVLETTGRKSGLPRQVPVSNGLEGKTFWIVSEQGRRSDYVRNIEADPRVRVRVGRRWHSGQAHVLADKDPSERLKSLGAVNRLFIRAMGTDLLTIRVDLD